MKNKNATSGSSVVVGTFFILIGIVWIIKNYIHLDVCLKVWWPLILIGIGFLKMADRRDLFSVSAWILILLGGVFLLTSNNVIEWWQIKKFWPLIIIMIGLSVFSQSGERSGKSKKKSSGKNYISGITFFSGMETKSVSKSFKGGNITVIFGRVKLNLGESRLSPKGALLELRTLFGSIELIIPDDWNVEINSTSVFGGVEDNSTSDNSGIEKPITLKVVAIFGGVEIKN